MTPRILTTTQARRMYRGFDDLRGLDGFPRPLVAKPRRKLWDSKAIERFLDRMAGLEQEEDAIEREMLNAIRQ